MWPQVCMYLYYLGLERIRIYVQLRVIVIFISHKNNMFFLAASPETCAYYNSDFGTFAEDYKEFLKNFFLAQIDGFEKGDRGVGWYFWTAKTENNCAPEWDFLFLVQNGIIPQDLCSRQSYCKY